MLMVLSIVFTFMIVLTSMPYIGKSESSLQQSKNLKLQLKEIKMALYGFVLNEGASLNGPTGSGIYRFPCPDTDGDGLEDLSAGACQDKFGSLPWLTLSLPSRDSWNQRYIYHVTESFSDTSSSFLNSSFSNASIGSISVFDSGSLGTLLQGDIAVLLLSRGEPRGSDSSHEEENLNENDSFVKMAQSTLVNSEFDDHLVWVTRSEAVAFLCDRVFPAMAPPNCP